MLRPALACVLALAASPTFAEETCGAAKFERAGTRITLYVKRLDGGAPDIYFFTAESRSGDFGVSVSYTTSGLDLAAPKIMHVLTFPTYPAQGAGRPEKIKWRFGAGAWSTSRYPQRLDALQSPPPPGTKGQLMYKIAQRGEGAMGWGPEWFDHARQGGRFTITRLAEGGEDLATGTIDFPNHQTVAALYREARDQALGAMKNCEWIYLKPASPPPRTQ